MTGKFTPPIVADPGRAAPALAVHETVVVAPELPLVGFTETHVGSLLDAPHVPTHVAGDPVTVTGCDPAAAGGLADAGLSAHVVQGTSPDPWLTGKFTPPIVADPVRAAPALAVHETVVVAPELPLVGFTETHVGSLLDAPHVPTHVAGDPVTVTGCDPAAAGGLADAGLSAHVVQGTSPDPWLTGKFTPPIVADPGRAAPALAVHETVVEDPFDPLEGLTESHVGSLLDAPHVPTHVAGDPITVTGCDPAAAGGLADAGLSAHVVQDGAGSWVRVYVPPEGNDAPPLPEKLIVPTRLVVFGLAPYEKLA